MPELDALALADSECAECDEETDAPAAAPAEPVPAFATLHEWPRIQEVLARLRDPATLAAVVSDLCQAHGLK